MNNPKKHSPFITGICIFLTVLGFLCIFSAGWYISVFGDVGVDSIIYTLFSDSAGVNKEIVYKYIFCAFIPAVILALLVIWALFWEKKKFNFKNIFSFNRKVSVAISIVLSLTLITVACMQVKVFGFVYNITAKTNIYEEKYVDPTKTKIVFPENKQNVVYIMLESMETTYFSEEQGGALKESAIPELYSLAKENTNFSHSDTVGGYYCVGGTSWTMGSIVAQTSGIPLKIPKNIFDNNSESAFLQGAYSITNILKDNGYYTSVMYGSNASYGNRDVYYKDHGIDKIYDYKTAQTDGIIEEGYYDGWWGMEDKYLFEYAKQELVKIAQNDEPFFFTLLTVDTHHVSGNLCDKCKEIHNNQYENVLSCSSKQAFEFVNWIQSQDFYENTTIVIVGDHCTMDAAYIRKNVDSDYNRRIYNCIINSKIESENTKNRVFCAMDLFPTTLAAMGCTIEGDRLGLGTNLYSDTPTLCEELGVENFGAEISKNSEYYYSKFMLQ